MFIAEDLNQFKNLFVGQLRNMLSDDELGVFILVLANSLQDDFLKSELEDDLKNTFVALRDNFNSGGLNATQDDIDVFNQLLDVDLNDLPVWQLKNTGDWEIAFNVMRQFRPARTSSQNLSSIIQAFDEIKFHFNKAFLQPEILWQGSFQNKQLRVFYNKFPFSPYHLLILVSPEENYSQLLTQEKHQYIFSLTQTVSEIFPGFGVGFNSLAAGASVNHFHFQGFVRQQDFPVEKNHWLHNGGKSDYPLDIKRFSGESTSWDFINQLIKRDVAFNCLYRKNACYVIPRKYQGAVDLPDWLNGAGWIDVAGVITVSDEEMFDVVDGQSVANALALLK
jgi:diadenosine tetraphosphate (Ap4A) HIT family hydrolase